MQFLFQLIILILFGITANPITVGQNTKAVWLYGFQNWMNAPNFGNRIAVLSSHSYNKISLGVASDQLNVQGAYQDNIIAFITQAKTAGMEVDALTLQDPHFTFSDKHNKALIRISDILQYNTYHPATAFSGIQIDPEPHILTEASHLGHNHLFWTTLTEADSLNAAGGIDQLTTSNPTLADTIKMRRDTIMGEFVALLESIRTLEIDPYNVANDPDITFSSTVGWWYNERRKGVPNGYLPSGATDLDDHLDYLVPMVYSGGVGETPADVVSRVTDEIQDAQSPTLVGISSESLVNFTGGVPAAEDSIDTYYSGNAAYLGTSVFEYDHLISSASFCPTVVMHDDLYDWVNDTIIRSGQNMAAQQATMPRDSSQSDADDYEDPTASQMDDWGEMLDSLLNGVISDACALATGLGYELIDFRDTTNGKSYYVLRTIPYDAITNPDPNFWGTYILHQKPRLSSVVIQAPHPIKDTNTGRQGVGILQETDAWFYMMAGTHRCNLICETEPGNTPGTNCSSCSGSTSVCHAGNTQHLYPISDMAHNDSSIFQKTTEVLQAYRNPYFIQLHGFGKGTNDPFAIISNGTAQAPGSGIFDPTPHLAAALHNHCGLGSTDNICVYHLDLPPNGSKCDQLKGFNNTQGRMLNNDPTPCDNEGPLTPSGRFIHLEQAMENFRDSLPDYRNVGRAILEAFNPGEFQVAAISDTTGIGIKNFEPNSYTYNFIAPLRSELLCKNNHIGTTPVTNLTDIAPSTTYEDETGSITASDSIGRDARVWLIAEESITLTTGFTASSNDFFSAEIKQEEDFCNDPGVYTPSSFVNRFFTSIYGPRMTSSGNSIARPYDFHRGEDMVDKAVPDSNNLPDLICMCDGVVVEMSDGSSEGLSVIVRCDTEFNGNPSFDSIHLAYRHLDSFVPGMAVNDTIRKGDIVGVMGETGVVSSPHLHFSVLRKNSGGEFINMHPMRVFNHAVNQHLNLPIDDEPTGPEPEKRRVNMFLLDYQNGSTNGDSNWAEFRIVVPYNKVSIRAIRIQHGSYLQIADFEGISEERDGNQAWLDDPVVDSLKLFPLQFVRGGSSSFSVHGRYDKIKDDLCDSDGHDICDHPAITHPIENVGIFTTPAYNLDIRAKGLPQSFDPYGFEVDVLDIWGNGVRGTLSPPVPIPLAAPPTSSDQTAVQADWSSFTKEPFSLSVFPNPSSAREIYVNVNSPEAATWQLTVVNTAGQVLLQRTLHSEGKMRYTLDVSALGKGIYFVRAQTEGQVLMKKLVRE